MRFKVRNNLLNYALLSSNRIFASSVLRKTELYFKFDVYFFKFHYPKVPDLGIFSPKIKIL